MNGFYPCGSYYCTTVEIVHNETGCNEQPGITSRFGAEVRSRRCTYTIIAISVITRTGYNEQIRLDLGARYIRFLLYLNTIFDVAIIIIASYFVTYKPLIGAS